MLLYLLASVDTTRPIWNVNWELSQWKCLISFAEEDPMTAPKNEVATCSSAWTPCHHSACLWLLHTYHCNPATCAAPPKDHQRHWGRRNCSCRYIQACRWAEEDRGGSADPQGGWRSISVSNLQRLHFCTRSPKTSGAGWEGVLMRMF